MTFTPVVRSLECKAIAHGNALVVDNDPSRVGQPFGQLLMFEFRPYHILASEKRRPGVCGTL